MTNGKVWLFVPPAVGIPLFFAGVAITALTVHFAVLNNTTWFPAYWNGKTRPAAASVNSSSPAVALNGETVTLAAASK